MLYEVCVPHWTHRFLLFLFYAIKNPELWLFFVYYNKSGTELQEKLHL